MADGSPNPFTTVTNFSKILALILFILLPFGGFYLGIRYQEAVTVPAADVTSDVPNNAGKAPQTSSFGLKFRNMVVTLNRTPAVKSGETFWSLSLENINLPEDLSDVEVLSELFKNPMGKFYYSPQTDTFYDLQPGGYSVLRLTDSKELASLTKNYQKVDKATQTKTKYSCNTFHYPIGLIDAVSISCTTTITIPTGGDESTIANCYLPLETGTYLGYEQKAKPIGMSFNMCERLSRMGVTGVTWLKNAPEPPNEASSSAVWKTYKDDTLIFSYPGDWEVKPRQVFGSRSEIDFTFKKTTTLALSYVGNYNNGTGKQYASLSEFLYSKINPKEITIEGRPGLHVFDPGEPGHVTPFNQAAFFTSDKQFIISFYYEPGNYTVTGAEIVLDKILSSLKFVK